MGDVWQQVRLFVERAVTALLAWIAGRQAVETENLKKEVEVKDAQLDQAVNAVPANQRMRDGSF